MPSSYYQDSTEMVEAYGMSLLMSRMLSLTDPEPFSRLSAQNYHNRCVWVARVVRCPKGQVEHVAQTTYHISSGEAGTGKSCLLHHFIQNTCEPASVITGVGLQC